MFESEAGWRSGAATKAHQEKAKKKKEEEEKERATRRQGGGNEMGLVEELFPKNKSPRRDCEKSNLK